MSVAGTDSYGTFLDTGTNTATTLRVNVDTEVHTSRETDTGASLPSGQTVPTFYPRGTQHRPANSPR